MLHQIKAPQFYTDLDLRKQCFANGKIHGLFKAFECFSSTFQGKFYIQGLSRQSCIFKYFSSQFEFKGSKFKVKNQNFYLSSVRENCFDPSKQCRPDEMQPFLIFHLGHPVLL